MPICRLLPENPSVHCALWWERGDEHTYAQKPVLGSSADRVRSQCQLQGAPGKNPNV